MSLKEEYDKMSADFSHDLEKAGILPKPRAEEAPEEDSKEEPESSDEDSNEKPETGSEESESESSEKSE